jgi:Na+(H+)/acetate symporter ActP
MYVSGGVLVCFIYITMTYAAFCIVTLCRSASLFCCARLLVPPLLSTCLRSANLDGCAIFETTIVSPIYITLDFGVRCFTVAWAPEGPESSHNLYIYDAF